MLFLVDGYNVTRSDPATRDLALEAQRDALIARLRSRGRELLGAGRIVVVFDGQGHSGVTPSQAAAPVEIRFSRGEIADDVLARIAEGANERVVLVSSDSELAGRVRTHARHGCEVRGREALFDSAGRGPDRKGPRRASASSGVPAGANRITEELKKLWLEDEE